MSGKLIVIYGTNNLGKTTQAKILVKKLKKTGLKAKYLKYPIYDLKPTGPKLNKILRSNQLQKIAEVKLQQIFAQNRRHFQPQLKKLLQAGYFVIAEDYIGTGLAWGITKGVAEKVLKKQNQGLIKENLAILLYGKRFLDGQEKNHLHENHSSWIEKCQKIHLKLAKKYGWQKVFANQPKEKVAQDIWQIVRRHFNSYFNS